jgi:hypothetical protein
MNSKITGLFFLVLLGTQGSWAEDIPVIELSATATGFSPARVQVPAHQKFKLLVKNETAQDVEFESRELNREKVVSPGSSFGVFMGPLAVGEYQFFDDFKSETARGVLEAR